MYQLTNEESESVELILAAAAEHEGFVNGSDVAVLARIVKKAFGSKDSLPKKTSKPASRKPAKKISLEAGSAE